MFKKLLLNNINIYKGLIIRSFIYFKFIWKLYIKKPIIILVWHQVSEEFKEGFHNKLDWTSLNDLEKSIRYLQRKKFNFISLKQAYDILYKSKKRKHRYVVITFDDGYSTIKDIIPLLEKYCIPATFFINTAYLDGRSVKWPDIENFIVFASGQENIHEHLKPDIEKIKKTSNPEKYNSLRKIIEESYSVLNNKNQIYITKKELFEIENPLFSIGLHGHEHEHHARMPAEWGKQNIYKNYDILRDHPNFIPFIAFPFGSYTAEEADYWENNGFKTISSDGLCNYKNSYPLRRSSLDDKIASFRLFADLSGERFSFRELFNL